MFDMILKSNDAKQAPYYLSWLERPPLVKPFSVDVWICTGCLRMVPAIGIQAEFRPTDWELVKGDGFSFLLCPECKESGQ